MSAFASDTILHAQSAIAVDADQSVVPTRGESPKADSASLALC